MTRQEPLAIRVLVAEPFPMTSKVICRALAAPGVEVVGSVADGTAIVARTRALRPDVVVLDGALGYRNGTDLIAQLKTVRRPPKIIVLGNHADPVYREAAAASGADRFVLKVRLFQELLPAIRSTLGR
jgi:DNA-binding NarL/FixJ family response regulator